MRIDITSFFFNSKIIGKTATCAWGTSIGQADGKQCRIEDKTPGITDMVVALTYRSVTDVENFDLSAGSSNREVLIYSVFDKVFVNGLKIDGSYILVLTREKTRSHNGRLNVSYPYYAKYKNEDSGLIVDNSLTIAEMRKSLGCSDNGSWFAYELNVKNQDELHFSCMVLDSQNPTEYSGTSKDRSLLWSQMVQTQNPDISFRIVGNPIQSMFFGAPGTGKSFKINEEVLKGVDNSRIFRTTFHPDTDYASFVGCYKPKMEGKDISYEFVPQVFTDAYIKAWSSDEPVYLVIEEINRGNCAQIFGDLFQLLDRKNGVSEYSIKADKDLCKYLTDELGTDNEGIADGNLKLPANFNILATMNTSDQSLFPMDSAFKRRWEWEYVPIDTDHEKAKFQIKIGDKEYLWPGFLKEINTRIKKSTDSEDKQMGEFFIKHNVDEKEFKSKVMFYLWCEICKDNPKAKKDMFMYMKMNDASGKEDKTEFTFDELFGSDSVTILQGFMNYLGIKEIL